jgi:hypothetical protein
MNFSGFGWNSECVDHLLCTELKAASLDPVLSTQSELGQTIITNPLKTLMLMFVLKDGTAKTTAAAQQLAKLATEADNNFELCVYSRVFIGDSSANSVMKGWKEANGLAKKGAST